MPDDEVRIALGEGRSPDRVIDALKTCESFEEVADLGILFHGSCEDMEGDLRGGAYDGVFWAADRPSVAQAYIPRSGSSTWIGRPDDYSRANLIRPNKHIGFVMSWALGRAGVTLDDLDVTWNGMQAAAWTIPPNWPTEGDLDDYIRGLGYEADDSGIYTVLTRYSSDGEEWMPAGWNIPGQLIIILPEDDFEIRDAKWSEEGLGYTAHNRVADFHGFSENGQHAFPMGDMLQSDHMGNVGHRSIGILPEGLKRISWIAIPAIRHDGDDVSVFTEPETPEFIAFMKDLNPAYRSAADAEPDEAGFEI